jgi:hypothetical protein
MCEWRPARQELNAARFLKNGTFSRRWGWRFCAGEAATSPLSDWPFDHWPSTRLRRQSFSKDWYERYLVVIRRFFRSGRSIGLRELPGASRIVRP